MTEKISEFFSFVFKLALHALQQVHMIIEL